jgi:hypothetical protein
MKTETQQQLLYIHTAFDKVQGLHNLTTREVIKMKTIKIENEKITLEEYQAKWKWSIEQFVRLNTFKPEFLHKYVELEDLAKEMVEDKFNSVYEAQNKGEE